MVYSGDRDPRPLFSQTCWGVLEMALSYHYVPEVGYTLD
jgi:hypothetical protein